MAKSKQRISPKILIPMIIVLSILTACQSQVVSTPAPQKKPTNPPSKPLVKVPTSPQKSGSITDPQKPTQLVNESYLKFELSTANKKAPVDIFEELDYFIGGGQRSTPNQYSPQNKKLRMFTEEDGDVILFHLSGFQPRESIRFLAYKYDQGNAYLYGWNRYQADKYGKLIISFENADLGSELFFAAIGDISGECLPERHGFMHSILKPESFQKCPNAPDQRVRIGDKARVCTKSDNLKVRSGPGKSKDSFMRIPPGTTMLIIDGPVCTDNWSWWKISLNDGTEGWVAEGGDQTDPYYICPIN